MNKHEKFMKSLYDKSDEELRELYKLLKKNKDEVSQKIADILYKYTINDGVMDIKKVDRVKLYRELSETINITTNSVGVTEIALMEKLLILVVQDTFEFWNYNINYEDVRKIIKKNFKGKHFSDRVWENEEEVAKRLHKLTHDFLDGKINVNQIKRNLEKIFNSDAYNVKRLVETEVARCSSNAFDRFCEETGVKKVRYNATLDNRLCDDCSQYHDKVFDFKDKVEVPRHPLCRCFYTIEDDDYKRKSRVDEEIAVSKEDYSDIISSKEWLNANFSSQKKFESHFKHLSEYGDITQEEYLNIARELLSADLSEDVEGFISNQGWAFKYRKSTNDFAMGHPKGTISTLFKPKEGYKYFLSEKEKYQ